MPSLAHADFWTPDHLARVTRGRWLAEPRAEVALAGVNIDTRSLRPGQVYVAIRGERFDGNTFTNQALQAGAAMAIVDRDVEVQAKGPVLRVDDTVAALQAMAAAYRDALREAGCRVIAITGSNGKTTTRNLIHTVLSAKLRGTQSPKSFNNHLGVPLTLLGASLEPPDDFVVVEIGSNHPGEVAALGKIVRPDAAVVTSIGHEHMEFFGALENVAKEEFSIAGFVEGPVFVPASHRLPAGFEAPTTAMVFEDDAAVPSDLPLPGEHNRRNAAAAAAVARWFGLDDATITRALRGAKPVDGRLQRIEIGSVSVIHDAYNANPSSMAAALRTLATLPVAQSGRRVAILGDMFELGDEGPQLHRGTAEVIAGIERETPGAIAAVVTIGSLSMFTADALQRAWPTAPERVRPFAAWSDDLPAQVAALLRPSDLVLLKGSRGMKLERLLPAIEATFGGPK